MLNITLKGDWEKWRYDWLGRQKVIDKAFKALGAYAFELEAKIVRNITGTRYGRRIADTGQLAHATFTQTEKKQHRYKVVVNKDYAQAVEYGTKPHYISNKILGKRLVPWVRRKLGITNTKKAIAIARAIRRKIAKKGTKGRPYFHDAVEYIENKLHNFLDEVGKLIIND